jgi:PEP-CTERM motif
MTGRIFESSRRVARSESKHFRPTRLAIHIASLTVAFLFVVAVGPALAASINYGSFMGSTVTYVDVTEGSNSGDPLPLFGPPTVSGDSLDFDPVGFNANATGAGGVDVTDGNLKFMVMSKGSNGINALKLSEAGDTTLAGFGTDATFTAVTGTGILKVNAVDGVGINTISVPFSMTFTPSGGTFGLLSDGGGGPLFSSLWSGGVMLDINAILTAKGQSYVHGATKITVNLDNTLTALSQLGTSSLIAKKDFGGLSVTVIPEPSTCLLFGIVVIGLALGRRK